MKSDRKVAAPKAGVKTDASTSFEASNIPEGLGAALVKACRGRPLPKPPTAEIIPFPTVQAISATLRGANGIGAGFLSSYFCRSVAPICVCSFANDDPKQFPPKHLYTRDFAAIERFVAKWDVPGRAVYFGVNTVQEGKDRRKENTAEITGLHADLDFSGVMEESQEEIPAVLDSLPLLPQQVNFSGHGLHLFFVFREALPATPENIERVEAALKRLSDVLATDRQSAEVVRVLRVPGSHNTKRDGNFVCTNIRNREGFHTLEQLEEWLQGVTEPLLTRREKKSKDKEKPAKAELLNDYSIFARKFTRLDIDERLDDLCDGNVHEPIRDVIAAQLCRSMQVEELLTWLRVEVLKRMHAQKANWELWQTKEYQHESIIGWLKKHPELIELQNNPPQWLTKHMPKIAAAAKRQEAAKQAAEVKQVAEAEVAEIVKEEAQAWPELAPEALHGIAGKVVALFDPHTEADRVALLMLFLASFGNAIGRGVYYQVEGTKHYTILYTVLVGKTSKSRKGTTGDRIRQLMREVAPDWMPRNTGGLSSGEGLISEIKDDKSKENQEPQNIDFFIPSDKRLFVDEREFAQALIVMKRDGNTLSRVIRTNWDCPDFITSIVRNNKERATAPHITIVGHITKDELVRMLDETSMANGYANRFLYVCARRSKVLPFGGNLKQSAVKALAAEIEPLYKKWYEANLEITWEQSTRKMWASVYRELSGETPGMLGAITGARKRRQSAWQCSMRCSTAATRSRRCI